MNGDLDWLSSTGFFTIKLGLSRTEHLLELLGRPQDALRFIHVAGSNGKGSVCSLTERALRNAGYKTGFYSSPHLIHLNERFRINGKPAEGELFHRCAETVREKTEELRKRGEQPSYFEITTAIALEIFRAEKVDFAVWETGMGGRLDATNVVRPEVSVITGISLEHTACLGTTLGEIAREKAGIIKTGVPVVCGQMPEEALSVVERIAGEKNAPLIKAAPFSGKFRIDRVNLRQELELEGIPVVLSLPGAYQRNNASTAFQVLKVLSGMHGFDFRKAVAGFADAGWNARFQFVRDRNLLIDGAHNPEGMTALADSLREFFPGGKFHFISGCFADKNAEDVVKAFAPLAEDAVFVAFDGDGREVCSPERLGRILETYAPGTPWKEETLEKSLEKLPDPGRMTVLCGSLHMCGEALDFLGLPG